MNTDGFISWPETHGPAATGLLVYWPLIALATYHTGHFSPVSIRVHLWFPLSIQLAED
jgi:hypothetical protein